jgi:ribosomal silencing factor RsfS
MTSGEPTLEMLFKRYVRQQSTARILWNDEKKQAAGKKIDVATEFNKGLGKHLDKLNALGLVALDVKKNHKPTDAKTKQSVQAVKTEQAKVTSIISDYKAKCKKGENSPLTPDGQKQSWRDLDSALGRVADQISNFLRPIVKG